jgi:hypothetical protein
MNIRLHLRTERPSKKTGECPIVISYHSEGKTTFLSTGKKILPKFWNKRAVYSWVTPEYGDTYQAFNRTLAAILKQHEKKVNDFFIANEREPNIEEVKNINTGRKKEDKSFFYLFDAFMNARKYSVTAGTYKNYQKVKKRFEDYQEYNGTPFGFSSINHGFHTHFTNYLIKEHRSQANTIGSYFRILKTFIHWAELYHNVSIDKVVMANMHVLREQNFYVWLTL